MWYYSPTHKKGIGESCPSTADCECGLGIACSKKDYYNEDKYICCENTFVPGGWTSDLYVQPNEGDRCPTTEDDECASALQWGKKDYFNENIYLCCKDTFVPIGWTSDLCVQQNIKKIGVQPLKTMNVLVQCNGML